MKVLFGVCTLGLGHASRSLPLIRRLVAEGHEVEVLTAGRTLTMLRKEMGDALGYIELPDYTLPYPSSRGLAIASTFVKLPRFTVDMKLEHLKVIKIVDKGGHDLIISDNRYGVYALGVPSYLLSHQLRYITPKRSMLWENGTERFHRYFEEKFRKALVPDFEMNSLSGDLSHNLNKLDPKWIEYIGPLSDFKAVDAERDIDVLISITGPEPHRTNLQTKVLEQIDDVKGKVAVTLGKSEHTGSEKRGRHEIYYYLDRHQRELLMNRSKFFVSRPGYSTLMDIAAMGKGALFVPPPNQTEQQYLSSYHMERKTYFSVQEKDLDLARDIELAEQYPGIVLKDGVETSVKNALAIMGVD